MYVVAIPIPDNQKTAVLDAFASTFNYQADVQNPEDPHGPMIPNPITREQHLEDRIGTFILEITSSYLVNQAAMQARNAAQEQVDAEAQAVRDYFNSLRQAREHDGKGTFGGDTPDVGAQSLSVEATNWHNDIVQDLENSEAKMNAEPKVKKKKETPTAEAPVVDEVPPSDESAAAE